MAKAEKVKIPVNVDINPGKAANATIALHQAIESFSYEERQQLQDMMRNEMTEQVAKAGQEDEPAKVSPAEYDTLFEANTARIVKRAEAFWAFLESA